MKRAFVTGVSGYIGGSVARRLVQDGFAVVGLVRDPAAAAHFSDGAPQPRKFASAPLVRALGGAASTLAGVLQRSTALVRS